MSINDEVYRIVRKQITEGRENFCVFIYSETTKLQDFNVLFFYTYFYLNLVRHAKSIG
jgi:hypothetical protein